MAQTELKVVAVDWKPEELANLVDNMIQNLAILSWLNLLLRALAVYYVDGAERIASGASKKSIELQMQSYSTRLIYSAILFSSYAMLFLPDVLPQQSCSICCGFANPKEGSQLPPKIRSSSKIFASASPR